MNDVKESALRIADDGKAAVLVQGGFRHVDVGAERFSAPGGVGDVVNQEINRPVARDIGPAFVQGEDAGLATPVDGKPDVTFLPPHLVPAKDLPVKHNGRFDVVVAGLQLIPDEGVGGVDDLGASVPARLPDAKKRADRILGHHKAPFFHHVHRRHDDNAAGCGDPFRNGFGVVMFDIRGPMRGHALGLLFGHQLPYAGDSQAVEMKVRVARAIGRRLIELPAEELRVEGPGALKIAGGEIDPTENAVGVSRYLTHMLISLVICDLERKGGDYSATR